MPDEFKNSTTMQTLSMASSLLAVTNEPTELSMCNVVRKCIHYKHNYTLYMKY